MRMLYHSDDMNIVTMRYSVAILRRMVNASCGTKFL